MLWLAMQRVLPVLAVLGFLLTPFTPPAVAGGMNAPMAMLSGDNMVTAEDMPCCPAQKPMMPDCMKACPLLTLCLAKVFQGGSTIGAVLVRIGIAEHFARGNDASPDTLAQGPPPRPPQA
jgi:hypothetical protein